jgi:hypothetical protein
MAAIAAMVPKIADAMNDPGDGRYNRPERQPAAPAHY